MYIIYISYQIYQFLTSKGGDKMSYILLSKIFYKEPDLYMQRYQERFKSETSVKLPINIHNHPSFFTIPLEMLNKIEKIYKLNHEITKCIQTYDIPAVAIKFLINKFLKDEIMLTNDIEGIYSTRKEIEDSIYSQQEDKDVRFKGLVSKYLKLTENDEVDLQSCADIRALYDDIVLSEIDAQNIPDGKYFRKEGVQIVSATQKEKHKGLVPETNIIEHMNLCLEFLKNEQISMLIRVAIFHYYFGYMHPFYDGNGRTSRFISSYLLKDELGILPALRLSYTIKNNMKVYYNAFDVCNDTKNKGELTAFILMFLDLLQEGEEAILDELKELGGKLTFYKDRMKRYNFNERKKSLVYILCQNALFDNSYVTLQELLSLVKMKDTTLRHYLKELAQEGFLCKEKYKNKYRYSLNLQELERSVEE